MCPLGGIFSGIWFRTWNPPAPMPRSWHKASDAPRVPWSLSVQCSKSQKVQGITNPFHTEYNLKQKRTSTDKIQKQFPVDNQREYAPIREFIQNVTLGANVSCIPAKLRHAWHFVN
ncbi:hypothetical protein AVEN_106349-1 [Araneus ventricosus]|uniref:Uncharacterized protein n=1 Tax=Araneus ventricosus TaxID=182803 RepID=A0A4Y2AS69_ARAVE|nr:hypothetical protein AVEN_106349-1 [Araneus ventricosus]